MKSFYCLRCHKPLSVHESVERGLGPVCVAIIEARNARESVACQDMNDKVDIPFDNETKDIICRREEPNGIGWRNHFNIHQIYRHHSPSGMNWGYGGSGPADFAMNILEHFVREAGEKPTEKIRCFDEGENYEVPICRSTLRFYQAFKRDVVCGLPKEGGTIKGDDIRKWLAEQKAATSLFV